MRIAIIILVILAVFMAACAKVEDTTTDVEITDTETTETVEEEKANSDPEVRLVKEGFDADKVYLNLGESLTIMIFDDDVKGHYILLDEQRILPKDMMKGDKLNVPFNEKGTFQVVDETSKESLTVVVQ
jgi:hypothetical protein